MRGADHSASAITLSVHHHYNITCGLTLEHTPLLDVPYLIFQGYYYRQ
jgi:hypothetical protein